MAKQKEFGITWATHTFNPWRGCTKISEGCTNCYADELSKRNPKTLGIWGPNGTRVLASEAMWREPIKWNREYELHCQEIWENHGPTLRRPRVFCASLADVFEEWKGPIVNSKGEQLWINHDNGEIAVAGKFKMLTPETAILRYLTMDDVRRRLFALIDATPNLDYLLLTKRPENIRKMLHGSIPKMATALGKKPGTPEANIWHRNNLWLGCTVENQEQADKRIPHLLDCRDLSPVLFLSCEPLLGPVDLTYVAGKIGIGLHSYDVLSGKNFHWDDGGCWTPYDRIDWVIAGCESGSNARPMQTDWAMSLRDQCQAAGVAFFMKQMEVGGKVCKDVSRFPKELQLQEFPRIS